MSTPVEEDKKYKRSYKACLNCRTRKVKCDGWETEPPCSRCKRERKECIFVESKRGGQANVIAGRKRKAELDLQNHRKIPSNASINELWPHEQQLRLVSKVDSNSSYITPQYISTPPESAPGDQSRTQNNNKDANYQIPNPRALLHDKDGSFLTHYTRRMLSMGEELPPFLSHRDDHRRQDGSDTGLLQFLAKAAGNIARADKRDMINALDKHNSIEANSSQLHSHVNSESSLTDIGNTSRKNSNVQSSTSTPSYLPSPELNYRGSTVPPMIKHESSGSRLTMPPVENLKSVRPRPSSRLADIEYIGENSILTESAAKKFINLFFSTMHPFFPHIPPNLNDPDTLAGYPILLCAILTISSRYHSFDELDGKRSSPEEFNSDEAPVLQHIEVHERLWVYCQRLISQTVWAEASTRSIGTVFAFLLFTEWNPRAIHWRWSDYANADDPFKVHALDTSDENVAGLGAMRRSARMGWMLIGSAVRLAQDMGFMDNSSRIFLACHVSETFAAMNVSKRSMLSYSLSEIDLDSDDEDDEDTDEVQQPSKQTRRSKNKEADEIDLVLKGDEENLRMKTDTKLKFSRIQKAKLELLQIMSICYETLYGVKPKLDGLGKRENLAVLNILSPLLENWHRTYKDLLKPTKSSQYTQHSIARHSQMIIKLQSKYTKDIGKQLDIESLIFDYHYARLYIYSLALTDYSNIRKPTSKSKRTNHHLRLDELTKSSKYVELAFNASKEMLACTQRLHKIRMLKYMPVRWVTRIVRAVAFVVKCYLTLTASQGSVDATIMSLSIIPLDEIISIIQKVAITLRELSPDELHLCTRYSTILMYLCSEMKSKISKTPGYDPELRPNDDENEPQEQSFENEEAFEEPQQLEQEYNEPEQDDFMGTRRLDYDFLTFPTDNILDWFKNDNGGGVGLDFVEPWTEMIEQQINNNKID